MASGCLCPRCPLYYGCRVKAQTLKVLEAKPEGTLREPVKLSRCERRMLELLAQEKRGLNVRQLASRLGISERHSYR